ncbi:hypothetical protein ArV1_052 [Arthrobacter phage vB_ArtM-ArV1]|uniref:Uncharacterized protein n=1 Tax=Arthrobacter phage vB_ArtM-ArV1 TaxID=1566993 RepID=A0A0A7HE68_9CAUD|nr:hypothetical protein ArV1_052 [Arthrobacter phage vB_ArtM-ArV1]AIZ01740.1 hypothetical protein ArV1_052 [Arthrobacter phage vB_ArtM-ArV1]
MSRRPGRAKMCGWLSSALHSIQTRPTNPADIKRLGALSVKAEKDLQALAFIAFHLSWNVSADLDMAWESIQEYDAAHG